MSVTAKRPHGRISLSVLQCIAGQVALQDSFIEFQTLRRGAMPGMQENLSSVTMDTQRSGDLASLFKIERSHLQMS